MAELEDGDVIIHVNEQKESEKSYSMKGKLRLGNEIILFRVFEKTSEKGKIYFKGLVYQCNTIVVPRKT